MSYVLRCMKKRTTQQMGMGEKERNLIDGKMGSFIPLFSHLPETSKAMKISGKFYNSAFSSATIVEQRTK
jgi:hypothetical protein